LSSNPNPYDRPHDASVEATSENLSLPPGAVAAWVLTPSYHCGKLGVHHNAVNRRVKRYREGGWDGLSERRRGRPPGEQAALSEPQQQDRAAMRRWLAETYPAICARAKREGGMVLWLVELGVRSDAAAGRSWAPVGQTR
jgi:hypothetical protein